MQPGGGVAEKMKVLTIAEIKNHWEGLGEIYTDFDQTVNGFYLSLVGLMQIPHAKHIL